MMSASFTSLVITVEGRAPEQAGYCLGACACACACVYVQELVSRVIFYEMLQ